MRRETGREKGMTNKRIRTHTDTHMLHQLAQLETLIVHSNVFRFFICPLSPTNFQEAGFFNDLLLVHV